MSCHTLTTIDVPAPAYSHCSNSVRVLKAILEDFLSYATGEQEGFHCVHDDEIPAIVELIDRAEMMQARNFPDLDKIQEWLLDYVVIAPRLWD